MRYFDLELHQFLIQSSTDEHKKNNITGKYKVLTHKRNHRRVQANLCFWVLINFKYLIYLVMSWLIFLGKLAKIFLLDTHAKMLQFRTHLDIILPCNMAKSWQDILWLIMFLWRLSSFISLSKLTSMFSSETWITFTKNNYLNNSNINVQQPTSKKLRQFELKLQPVCHAVLNRSTQSEQIHREVQSLTRKRNHRTLENCTMFPFLSLKI